MLHRLLSSLALAGALAAPAAADHDRCGYRPAPYRVSCGARAWRGDRCGWVPRSRVCCETRPYVVCRRGWSGRSWWRSRCYGGAVAIAPIYTRLSMGFDLDDPIFDRSSDLAYGRVVEPAGPIGGRFLIDCD